MTENKRALQEQLDHRVNKVFWQSLLHIKSSQLSNVPAREGHINKFSLTKDIPGLLTQVTYQEAEDSTSHKENPFYLISEDKIGVPNLYEAGCSFTLL